MGCPMGQYTLPNVTHGSTVHCCNETSAPSQLLLPFLKGTLKLRNLPKTLHKAPKPHPANNSPLHPTLKGSFIANSSCKSRGGPFRSISSTNSFAFLWILGRIASMASRLKA
ncbi:hypothetical protein Vafri_2577 [Volvox africanus]|uniref:Uncharacterized protein n=1 Tax=Volvox africanus TaxID=51714 RepID=A0A8J4ATI9_9CHLO|nr:hypothetical protein Vafri_2577 [Volvox africanus]